MSPFARLSAARTAAALLAAALLAAAVAPAAPVSPTRNPSAAAAADWPPRCLTAGRTILRSERSRLFGARGRVYGCARGGERLFFLTHRRGCFPDHCYLLRAIAGRFTALISGTSGRDGTSLTVRAVDLANGRRGHVWRSDSETAPPGQRYAYDALDLVVNGRGSLAWIIATTVSPSGGGSQSDYRVLRSDGSGEAVLLDASDQIDPRSLELTGSTLRWINDGRARTATLG